jgi:hypothetical protein
MGEKASGGGGRKGRSGGGGGGGYSSESEVKEELFRIDEAMEDKWGSGYPSKAQLAEEDRLYSAWAKNAKGVDIKDGWLKGKVDRAVARYNL